jgi:hypothetical protein
MVASLTMPLMPRKQVEGSVNIQGRLTERETDELDAAAADQPVPVTRSALVSHILREWLRQRREAEVPAVKPPTPRGRA